MPGRMAGARLVEDSSLTQRIHRSVSQTVENRIRLLQTLLLGDCPPSAGTALKGIPDVLQESASGRRALRRLPSAKGGDARSRRSAGSRFFGYDPQVRGMVYRLAFHGQVVRPLQ